MWRNALYGCALAQCEGIQSYQLKRVTHAGLDTELGLYVVNGLGELPFYLRVPLKVYATLINILCLVITGHTLKGASPLKRERFTGYMRRLPLYGMFNKFVRSKVLLRLFDSP
ncbi:MAG: hypothetical protein HQM16_01660 [Deltaproteobacteria bacterium]|nr:hypothetical protein [Deltaproteobacteria bacterium]